MDRLIAWYRVGSSVGAVVALVIANLIPLAGALFFGWNVWMILVVYWLENGIVGAFNILKMLRAEGAAGPTGDWRMNGRPMHMVGRSAIAGFFLIHYGLFWVVHGVFVLTMPLFAGLAAGFPDATPFIPGEGEIVGGEFVDGVFLPAGNMTTGFEVGAVLFAVVALAISHGVSFVFNYLGRGEYRRASAAGLMFAPYGRLVVLHITIVLGGMAIAFTGAPAAVLAILVGLKTVVDIGFHLAEHRKVAVSPGTASA